MAIASSSIYHTVSHTSKRNYKAVWMAKLLLGAAPEPRSYTDIEPRSQWLQAEDSDTLLVDLSGFSKEQLKVTINTSGSLRINGERRVEGNRWVRFVKYFTIPKDCNPKGIQAKFDKDEGLLYVVLPKLLQAPRSQQRAPETKATGEETLDQATMTSAPQEAGERNETTTTGMTGTSVTRFSRRNILLVNIAVAILVVVGVGVYLGYKFRVF